MEAVLDDNELLEYVKTKISKPGLVDAHNLAQWKKDVAKARKIILECVRDHIVSNIHDKETPFTMWKALTNLFENRSGDRKVVLREKLRNIMMQKNQTNL